jgi:hypothetical protein
MEALSLPFSRRVQFADINDEKERQKIQKRSANNVLKKQKKEARKMAAQARREKVRYFLEFLKNTRVDQDDFNWLRQEISTNGSMFVLALMFPAPLVRGQTPQQAAAAAAAAAPGQLTSFCNVVSSLQLPVGNKRLHENQVMQLEQLVNFWTQRGLYDSDLDPFLQYLRERIGQGNLTEIIRGILVQPNQEVAEATAQATEQGLLTIGPIGSIPAGQLPADLQTTLRNLQALLTQGGAYHYTGLAIQSASSGDSSDTDEEDVYEF